MSRHVCAEFLLTATQLKLNETTVKQKKLHTIIIAYPLAFKEGVQ